VQTEWLIQNREVERTGQQLQRRSGLCGQGLLQASKEFVGFDTFRLGNEGLVAEDRVFGEVELAGHCQYESQIEVGVREVRFENRADFIMQARESEVALVQIQISEIVVGLEVAWVVYEREGEAVEGFGEFAGLRFDDPEVTVGFGHAISGIDGAVVGCRGVFVVVLVKKEGFFEGRQLSRQVHDLAPRLAEQVELSVPFEVGLLDRPDALEAYFGAVLPRKLDDFRQSVSARTGSGRSRLTCRGRNTF